MASIEEEQPAADDLSKERAKAIAYFRRLAWACLGYAVLSAYLRVWNGVAAGLGESLVLFACARYLNQRSHK